MAAAITTTGKAHKGPAMEGFVANWYAKITKGEAREYRRCALAVAERVPAGGAVLDLAAGPGYLAIELARLRRYAVFGLDISKSFVRIATENAAAEQVDIEFREGNAAQMPYADESFDYVVCRAAFKNFTDPVGALNEIHRVLKPGAKASVFDLRAESSRDEIDALVRGMNLSALSSFWTRMTFRFFLLKNAYSEESIKAVAAQSRFGRCELVHTGVEFELRLQK
jgi:ubiquinone/menaquinone biosynthesis C-methylase UbiE